METRNSARKLSQLKMCTPAKHWKHVFLNVAEAQHGLTTTVGSYSQSYAVVWLDLITETLYKEPWLHDNEGTLEVCDVCCGLILWLKAKQPIWPQHVHVFDTLVCTISKTCSGEVQLTLTLLNVFLCIKRTKLSDITVCECRRKRIRSDSSCAAFVVGFGVSSVVSTWSPHVDISVILPSFFLLWASFSHSLSFSLLFLYLFSIFFFSSVPVLHICLCHSQCSGLSFGPLYRPINGRVCLGQSGSDWFGVTTQSVFSLVTSVGRTYSSLPCCCRAWACPTV